MSRTAVMVLAMVLGGCGGTGGDVNETDIANRASAITQSANETVAAQIADIEEKAAQDAADDAPVAASNATASDDTKAR